MTDIIIKGREVYPGNVTAKALVTDQGIVTHACLDEKRGYIYEVGHPLYGKCIKDTVLVFPFGKGSTEWGSSMQRLYNYKAAPAAMLINHIDARTALGAVMGHIPTVTDFDIDPLTVIEDGDTVEVKATEGVVIVHKACSAGTE